MSDMWLPRFVKDTNPNCECFEDPGMLLVVRVNPECPEHGET